MQNCHDGKMPVSETKISIYEAIMQKKSSDCNIKSEDLCKIGERVRSERERLALSQAALSDYTGVSSKTQGKYETAETIPNADYLARFHELGADVFYIVTGQRAVGVVSDEEDRLLAASRAAPPALRQAALAVLQSGAPTGGVINTGEIGVQNTAPGGVSITTLNVGRKK